MQPKKCLPQDRVYSRDHVWVQRQNESKARIGLTDHFCSQMGQINYIELPDEGVQVIAGSEMGAAESYKATTSLISPVSGIILKVNRAVKKSPYLINRDPYVEGWLVSVELSRSEELEGLMSAQDYQAYTDAS